MSNPPADMPCKRDCEDRFPGCYCQRKRNWDAEQAAKKEMIYKEKSKEFAVGQVRNPPRAEKRRQKNVR